MEYFISLCSCSICPDCPFCRMDQRMVTVFIVEATMRRHYTMSSLNRDVFFSILVAGRPRSRCWQTQCLVRTLFLVSDGHFLLCPHIVHSREGKQGPLISSGKSTQEDSIFTTKHLPHTITLGIRLQCVNSEGEDKHSGPSSHVIEISGNQKVHRSSTSIHCPTPFGPKVSQLGPKCFEAGGTVVISCLRMEPR